MTSPMSPAGPRACPHPGAPEGVKDLAEAQARGLHLPSVLAALRGASARSESAGEGTPASADAEGGSRERRSQATELVDLALELGAELWHDEASEPWATVETNGHREHWRMKSKEMRRWLRGLYFKRHHRAPGAQGVHSCSGVSRAAPRAPRGRCCAHSSTPASAAQARVAGVDLFDPKYRRPWGLDRDAIRADLRTAGLTLCDFWDCVEVATADARWRTTWSGGSFESTSRYCDRHLDELRAGALWAAGDPRVVHIDAVTARPRAGAAEQQLLIVAELRRGGETTVGDLLDLLGPPGWPAEPPTGGDRRHPKHLPEGRCR